MIFLASSTARQLIVWNGRGCRLYLLNTVMTRLHKPADVAYKIRRQVNS